MSRYIPPHKRTDNVSIPTSTQTNDSVAFPELPHIQSQSPIEIVQHNKNTCYANSITCNNHKPKLK